MGTLKRVLVSNLVSYNSDSALCNILSGIPGFPIEDVKISNLYMEHKGGATIAAAAVVPPENETKYPDPGMFGPMPAQGFYLRHVRRLEMSHVEIAAIAPDARPAFSLVDVERADFLAVTAPGAPAFALHGVKDLRITASRATRDIVLDQAAERTL